MKINQVPVAQRSVVSVKQESIVFFLSVVLKVVWLPLSLHDEVARALSLGDRKEEGLGEPRIGFAEQKEIQCKTASEKNGRKTSLENGVSAFPC